MSEGDKPEPLAAEISAREIHQWDEYLEVIRGRWYAEIMRPMVGSLIDRAYHQGILPLPPLDMDGDGIWTRKEPWYIAVDG